MKIITIRTKCIILMEERDRILTRQMRLGHSYGMFASFGNDEFCTRRRGGCFQIPHLILTPSSKESSMSRQQQLQIKTEKNKAQANLWQYPFANEGKMFFLWSLRIQMMHASTM